MENEGSSVTKDNFFPVMFVKGRMGLNTCLKLEEEKGSKYRNVGCGLKGP